MFWLPVRWVSLKKFHVQVSTPRTPLWTFFLPISWLNARWVTQKLQKRKPKKSKKREERKRKKQTDRRQICWPHVVVCSEIPTDSLTVHHKNTGQSMWGPIEFLCRCDLKSVPGFASNHHMHRLARTSQERFNNWEFFGVRFSVFKPRRNITYQKKHTICRISTFLVLFQRKWGPTEEVNGKAHMPAIEIASLF